MEDIIIARNAEKKNIVEIARKLNIDDEYIEQYGKYKAKIDLKFFEKIKNNNDGKLILVTSINPTPLGEGKTTAAIGIADGLNKLNKKTVLALREPSVGPVFGIKGGATGGGYSQITPMEDINLHFTGDIHAITEANNLISAIIDNHIFSGNELKIKKVTWKRAVDLNDRQLRTVQTGLSGEKRMVSREDHFDITVASEIMAVFCLSKDLADLRNRLGKMIIGYNESDEPIYVSDLKIVGSLIALLKDAINPNLVQTLENNSCFVHGGPFANIAHGCNSILATKMALKLSDYTITEAGFAADLGAEKFFDIKCRMANITPDIVVIVATVRALKHHGNGNLKEGLENLRRHIENISLYNLPVVVAINKFSDDSDEDIELIEEYTKKRNVKSIPITIHENGGNGGIHLAEEIVSLLNQEEDIPSESVKSSFEFLYTLDKSIEEKIEILCSKIYGAGSIAYSDKAKEKIKLFTEKGFDKLPICMSKTPASLSDDPKLLGSPRGFEFKITDVNISAGAGFLVIMAGNILDMPGLPKIPAAEHIDIDENGEIIGLS